MAAVATAAVAASFARCMGSAAWSCTSKVLVGQLPLLLLVAVAAVAVLPAAVWLVWRCVASATAVADAATAGAGASPAAERFFHGKTVWVVGASSGIGAEMATQCAAHGARVVLSGRRQDRLQAVAAACEAAAGRTTGVAAVLPLDVTDVGGAEEATAAAVAAFGSLDVAVLNAGVDLRGSVATTALEVHRAILETNLLGAVALAGPLLRHFQTGSSTAAAGSAAQYTPRGGSGGRFLVMSSVAGRIPVPLSSSYAAAKHGLHGFFSSLAAEAAGDTAAHGAPAVRVTLVCPGPVVSEGSGAALLGTGSGTFAAAGHVADDGGKLPTPQCAHLALSATAAGVPEAWISGHPVLALVYIAWLCPPLARWLAAPAATVRMRNFAAAAPKLNGGLGAALLAALCSFSALGAAVGAAVDAVTLLCCAARKERLIGVCSGGEHPCGCATACARVLCCTGGRRRAKAE